MTTKYYVSGTSYSNLPTPNSISSGPTAPGSAVVANNTDVDINFSDGIGTAWSFSPTGMTFPDDTIQTTAYTSKYKVYTALVTFDGSFTINVLENTLGETITWSNPGNGIYRATSTGTPFTEDKTFIICTGASDGQPYTVVPFRDSNNISDLYLYLHDGTITSTPFLTKLPVEIRVYN